MFHAPDQRLIHFDGPRQARVRRAPSPPKHVATYSRPRDTVHQGSVRGSWWKAIFGLGHLPGGFELGGQRGTGLLQDRTGRHGRLVATGGAYQAPAGDAPWCTDYPTGRTGEPLRPPQGFQELGAGGHVREPCGKLTIGPRRVTSCHEGRGWRRKSVISPLHPKSSTKRAKLHNASLSCRRRRETGANLPT